jgi:signal transduction histidine kinase
LDVSDQERLVRYVQKKSRALSVDVVQTSLGSRQDLVCVLEQIVTLAYELTEGLSAELALFSVETGSYHSAFVQGTPYHPSAQAMLSGAADGVATPTAPSTIIQPIIFSGVMLGTLRVGLRRYIIPSAEQRELVRILAVQAGVAILNSRYAQELRRLGEAADEAVQAKVGFLANLSHEIRSPLGVMMNGVELVLRGLCGEVTEDMNEVLSMVKTSGAHLQELVNDVLDYAKADAGLLEVNVESIELSEVLTDVQKIIRPLASNKHHSLEFSSVASTVRVSMDRRQLRQILINLLTNAIKYTPDGGQIRVRVVASAGVVAMSVSDNGIGMRPEDLEKIFDPFRRAKGGYTQKQQGTGLGMALTKRLVELNKGRIEVVTAPGEGTTVEIKVPLCEQIDAQHDTYSLLGSGPEINGAGRRVMIFKFPLAESETVSRYLVSLGFQVEQLDWKGSDRLEAPKGRLDALVVCAHNTISMSDVAGLRSWLDASAKTASSKGVFVVVGAQASGPELEPLLRSGVDRYVQHPVSLLEISRAIDEAHRVLMPETLTASPPGSSDTLQ